jgi:hypothetical protein
MSAEKFFLSNGVIIGNLRDVRRLVDALTETYVCTIDLQTPPSPPEIGVAFTAVAGDVAPSGQWVFAQIMAGNFQGEITDFVPPSTEISAVEIVP